jgi:hypothetical protein
MIPRSLPAKGEKLSSKGKMGLIRISHPKEHGFKKPAFLPRRFRFRFLISIFCIGFLISGCEEGTPSLALVSGRVYYQNQPVPRGDIVFVPDADRGNNGHLAQGTIQSGGAFTIQTDGKPGAMPGWYRITIISVEEAGNYRSGATTPRTLVPQKYRDPQLSDLTYEVKAGRENTINFNLTP